MFRVYHEFRFDNTFKSVADAAAFVVCDRKAALTVGTYRIEFAERDGAGVFEVFRKYPLRHGVCSYVDAWNRIKGGEEWKFADSTFTIEFI